MSASTSLSDSIPLIDLSTYISKSSDPSTCLHLADALRNYGAVLIRDPRVNPSHEQQFMHLMERYFAQPTQVKMQDARPHLFYQVGVTPNGIERPRDNASLASSLPPSEKPLSNPSARLRDPKWRFFWRVGPRPTTTDFPELNAEQVIPSAFAAEWADTMDLWGTKLLHTIHTVAEMLGHGLGLGTVIREMLQGGPHLLAPTGSDMALFGENVGEVIAGFHYDLNLLTIHGRARYPGLFVWTRQGKRLPVVVPEGCLLVQSGLQLENLTGGGILKGMHEVVVSEQTSRVVKKRRQEGGIMWRVSSTMFAHVRSDASLKPLGKFGEGNGGKYEDIKAGEQVARELRALELAT